MRTFLILSLFIGLCVKPLAGLKKKGNVEKSRLPVRSARRQASGVLAVLPCFGLTDVPLFAAFALTYAAYAPRVTTAAACPSTLLRAGLDGPFDGTQGRLF